MKVHPRITSGSCFTACEMSLQQYYSVIAIVNIRQTENSQKLTQSHVSVKYEILLLLRLNNHSMHEGNDIEYS